MSIINKIKDKYFIDIWLPKGDNPKAPIGKLVFTNKDTKEREIYPMWNSKQKEGTAYLGELEQPYEKKEQSTLTQQQSQPSAMSELEDDIPF